MRRREHADAGPTYESCCVVRSSRQSRRHETHTAAGSSRSAERERARWMSSEWLVHTELRFRFTKFEGRNVSADARETSNRPTKKSLPCMLSDGRYLAI